jgi:hypothetical protein
MKTAEFPVDPLFELERKIARRADQLTRTAGNDREQALACWLQAEREIWNATVTPATAGVGGDECECVEAHVR